MCNQSLRLADDSILLIVNDSILWEMRGEYRSCKYGKHRIGKVVKRAGAVKFRMTLLSLISFVQVRIHSLHQDNQDSIKRVHR